MITDIRDQTPKPTYVHKFYSLPELYKKFDKFEQINFISEGVGWFSGPFFSSSQALFLASRT